MRRRLLRFAISSLDKLILRLLRWRMALLRREEVYRAHAETTHSPIAGSRRTLLF